MLSLWPRGHSWSFVLTHDVERARGYRALEGLRRIERDAGYVSSWNFVPLRDYGVEASVLDGLRAEGCEVGVHGLHHDGRDLDEAHLPARLRRMRAFADEWQAVGFRSPSLLRDFDVIPTLGFEYDSSYPDTDPLQAQAGGCCSWLPFHNRDVVELPITLPQDHNLFELLGESDETLWHEKAAFLARARRDGARPHPSGLHARAGAPARVRGAARRVHNRRKRLEGAPPRGERLVAAAAPLPASSDGTAGGRSRGPRPPTRRVAFCRDVFGYAAAAADS